MYTHVHLLYLTAEIFQVQNINGQWKWTNGTCPIHLHTKIKNWWVIWNFDGSFEKKRWAKETLISTLQQNEHQIWIAYVWVPAKNEIRITLSLIVVFFHKMIQAHPRSSLRLARKDSALDKRVLRKKTDQIFHSRRAVCHLHILVPKAEQSFWAWPGLKTKTWRVPCTALMRIFNNYAQLNRLFRVMLLVWFYAQ